MAIHSRPRVLLLLFSKLLDVRIRNMYVHKILYVRWVRFFGHRRVKFRGDQRINAWPPDETEQQRNSLIQQPKKQS